LALLHPGLVDHAWESFQHAFQPGALLFQLGLVVDVDDDPPDCRVLQEVPSPDPHLPHPPPGVQEAQAELPGLPGVAEEVL